MSRVSFLVAVSVLCFVAGKAQNENPHANQMERAHPTPVAQPSYEGLVYMVPMLTETVYPSIFVNTNMIDEGFDALPAQNESSIAVNPRNPSSLIGSAVDYRSSGSTWAYYSQDAGATWKNITLGTARPGWSSSNDPSVCFDHKGKGYLCYGGFRREGNVQFGENGIFISSTTDGGVTWAMKHTAVIIHTGQQNADSAFEDKYYVHADTVASSPHRGNLYIPWKRVINRDSSTQIHIARSTDEGVTWSRPIPVSDRFPGTSEATTFGQSFPLARTGPDGSVHLVWNSGTESAIRYAQSTDAGTTWSQPRVIQTYKPFGEKSTINGQSNSRVKGVVRAESYPTLVIDNTGGTRSGWLYLTWAADNYPNVYFSRSTDNGASWSAARIVHSDTTNDQFWSWIALDPTNGEVAIMYSDSRDDAANILVNTYVSWSSDGGTTWLDRRVGNDLNDLRRNPFQGNTFAGDYSGCDFYSGIIYPSWVDMRNTYTNPADNDVYTAVVDTRAPSAPRSFSARTIPDRPTEIDLAWSPVTTLAYGQPLPLNARIVIQRDGVPIDTLAVTEVSLTDRGLTKYKLYVYTLIVTTLGKESAPRLASAYAGGSRELGAPVLISAVGNENRSMDVTVQIPVLRLDGVTPIINLASLRSDLSEIPFTKSLSTSDTGKTVLHNTTLSEDGWYRVRVRVFDSENNASEYSDSLWAYTGSLTPGPQAFEIEPRYHRIFGSWGRTTNFFRSAPASYAHAPVGAYLANRRDTLQMFPIVIPPAIPEAPTLRMNYAIAAFVDPSDTMFLEVSKTGMKGDYSVVEWWNASRDARWSDTTKGDDAWRAYSTAFPEFNTNDTLHMRLRFRSNAARQSDGFYIDDITFDFVSSVEESQDLVTSISPNPSSSHLNITLVQDLPIASCRVIDVQGASHTVQWYQSGHTVVADVSTLPQGVYTVAIDHATRSEQHRFIILH